MHNLWTKIEDVLEEILVLVRQRGMQYLKMLWFLL